MTLLPRLRASQAWTFARAFARARAQDLWGDVVDEHLSNDEMIGEAYRGIRLALGFRLCPEHTVKGDVFQLLHAKRLGCR